MDKKFKGIFQIEKIRFGHNGLTKQKNIFVWGSVQRKQKSKDLIKFVNNGIARRNWAGNPGAQFAIKEAMKSNPDLKVTLPHQVDETIIETIHLKP